MDENSPEARAPGDQEHVAEVVGCSADNDRLAVEPLGRDSPGHDVAGAELRDGIEADPIVDRKHAGRLPSIPAMIDAKLGR